MMRALRLVAVLSSIVVPSILYAQRPPSADSVPRAGEWAAEFNIGSATGASLLRFWSPESALLLGAEFAVTHDDNNNATSGTYTNVSGRVGVRRYRRSSTERLRPVIGFGARGGIMRAPNDAEGWSASVYGELGAVYFVAPHLSVGGVGELQASYTKQT